MPKRIDTLTLKGLAFAPAQVMGAFRLVPVIRRECQEDLRLTKVAYNEPETGVQLNDGTSYWSYVPHGLILSWTSDGTATTAFGSNVAKPEKKVLTSGVRLLPRMVRRLQGNRLRFLPLHMAMEGFLALHFGGPDVLWSEYSKFAVRHGLGERSEEVAMGADLPGFDEALRTFEIHDRQVGVLVFVADAFTSAFIVPSPKDYRLLHTTLLEDFFSDLIVQYALWHADPSPLRMSIDEAEVGSLADLSDEVQRMRTEWAEHHLTRLAIDNLLERPVNVEKTYQAGPFTMERFVSDLNPDLVNHIGETIYREDGTLEYLKTYRLSAAQTRRAYLLSKLAKHDWHLGQTAEAFGQSVPDLILRLKNAGFGYLVAEHVLDWARAAKRNRR